MLKRSDVVGVDPVTRTPATEGRDGRAYTEEEVVELTLLHSVREERLVTKLDVFGRHGAPPQLSSSQREDPDGTLDEWPDEEKDHCYRAAGIVIETMKELNPDLSYEWLLTPGRKIALPDPALL